MMRRNRWNCLWSVPVLVMLLAPLFAMPSSALAGSPFYLTVERSFSNTESPKIRLDYSDPEAPMHFRVLRPKDLGKFLDGQFQISRSYEEPVTELNPGHYFVKGINRAESPLRTFRRMLDPKFRKVFKDTPFHGAILQTTPGDLATAPRRILLEPPDGFDLVHEMVVDLQFGGKDMRDLGWWFGEAAWNEDQYRIRGVTLDPLPDGIYLVQAVQGKYEAQSLMQVSSLAVQVKQSTGQLVVRVMDRALKPVPGASVSIRDGRGRWTDLAGKTDASGELFYTNPDGPLDGKLVVRALAPDGRQALTDTDFLPAVANDDSVFIVTDRPIFKPGEAFSYKGVVRAFEGGELKVPNLPAKDAKVTLIRSDGAPTDLHATVPVTDFGSFSGSFQLDDLQMPGLYRLVAEIAGKPYGGEFRVRDYVKPVFYLELEERSPTIVPGEPFFVKFKVRRYAGGVPQNVKFEVFLYRKKFEAPQWVAESGGGLAAGNDYFGEVRSASALTEPKRVFSSVEARLAELNQTDIANTWDSAPVIDPSGEGRFEFTVPQPGGKAGEEEWTYTLMVRAMDQGGSTAVLTENVFMTLSEAQSAVRFSEPVAKVGESGLSLAVRSVYPDGKPAPKAWGVVDLTLEQVKGGSRHFVKLPFTTDDRGVSRLDLPALSMRGKITAVSTLEALDGKPLKRPSTSEPAVLIVSGDQGESIVDNPELELYTASTILSPGDKARVLALLPVGWGKGEKGTLWETLSGNRIFGTRATEFKGRSRWFEVEAKPEYGTGFYQTVTVPVEGGKYREQTLGFRIVPRSKLLRIDVRPSREETEPLKPFRVDFEVKDADGAPAADTELAVTVVDRAVYAVQPEIRPGIFDFFYPLPRINLATFYSDELQGYGYADALKKPNFRLGALKSQSKPVKKSLRDTAGWFPHVVTDANGRASVIVDMPGNVTEWVVTAIAADRKGRVGEGKGRFRSACDVSVEVFAPQVLREGDTATVQVSLVNHLAKAVPVRAVVAVEGAGELKEGAPDQSFTLDSRGERLLSFTVSARGSEGGAVLRVTLESDAGVRVAGAEEFEMAVKPAAMRQVFPAVLKGDTLVTDLPEAGRALTLKAQVNSGLLGAALNAATLLVTYPYGCTEQLVHSTIPNLVLMDLVRKAGIKPEELGPLGPVLARAERNAALGVRKILRNQKSSGGFGLWPSDPEPSFAVTVTAASALRYAQELKVDELGRVYDKASDWLSSQTQKKDFNAGGGLLLGYLLANLAEIGGYGQPFLLQVAYAEAVSRNDAASIPELTDALRIFAAYKDKEWNRFGQHFKRTHVKEALVEELQQALGKVDLDAMAAQERADGTFEAALGFGAGASGMVAEGMGVLDRLGALPPDLEAKLGRTLLGCLRYGYWTSTFNTARVIFATRSILGKEAEAAAKERESGARTVSLIGKNGTKVGDLARIPSGFTGSFKEPGSLENLVALRVEGIKPDETADASIAADVPFGSVKPVSKGLVVERTFRRVTPGGSEPLEPGAPLRKGDVVVSEVLVRRGPVEDPRTLPSRFVVVEDGIPSFARAVDSDETYLADAGITPKDDTWKGSIKETQRYPDRTVRVAEVLPTGEVRVLQVWQVAFAGKSMVPPARAYDMYEEALFGNTAAVDARAE